VFYSVCTSFHFFQKSLIAYIVAHCCTLSTNKIIIIIIIIIIVCNDLNCQMPLHARICVQTYHRTMCCTGQLFSMCNNAGRIKQCSDFKFCEDGGASCTWCTSNGGCIRFSSLVSGSALVTSCRPYVFVILKYCLIRSIRRFV